MHRFFVPHLDLSRSPLHLEGAVLHHLATVVRLRSGDELELLDGHGLIVHCRLTVVARREVVCEVVGRRVEEETAFPIRLIQGVPKGEKMELVLQKGTELGVTAFSPVVCERSIPRIKSGEEGARQQRWERIIQEAARQCRRPLLPRLDPVGELRGVLAGASEELRLMLWEDGAVPLVECLPAATPAGAAVLVGPEGGFSPGEAELAVACGFRPVTLGRRILRSETAGFAVAAILQHRYGDLGRG